MSFLNESALPEQDGRALAACPDLPAGDEPSSLGETSAEILVECYRALDGNEALLLAARLSDHGARDQGGLMTPVSGVRVRPEDLPRDLAFLADDRPWPDDYKGHCCMKHYLVGRDLRQTRDPNHGKLTVSVATSP